LSLFAFAEGAIQLVPDGTLLIHLAVIVVMVTLLNRTLLKPINRILEERERRTKGRVAEARRISMDVDEKMREYQRRLRAARESGYLLLDEERRAASRNREELVSAVKAEVMRWHEEEKEKINHDQATVKSTLMSEAGARAAEISTRILGRPIVARR
jgi:F-type H+-transporting ATPase subunit b